VVQVVGGRLPDFLGGRTFSAEQILFGSGELTAFELSLGLTRKDDPLPSTESTSFQAAGIFDEKLRLTGLGSKLAYHLREFRRQAGEDGVPQAILDRAELGPSARVLDVGCGAGQTLILLKDREPAERVGLDIDLDSLALGCRLADEAKQEVAFVRGAATALPFPDGYFSHVLSRVTLNYVHQRAALAEQVRVLRPGGFLYCRAEGPGYDLLRLTGVRRIRPFVSFLYDALLGFGLAATGCQAEPGRFPAAGRAFATVGRLTRSLRRLGCVVIHAKAGATYGGLPASIELLAEKCVGPGRS
jgi:SAM-dependent methyltransferase